MLAKIHGKLVPKLLGQNNQTKPGLRQHSTASARHSCPVRSRLEAKILDIKSACAVFHNLPHKVVQVLTNQPGGKQTKMSKL